jgi:MYXO-CTERM domain-containing protein
VQADITDPSNVSRVELLVNGFEAAEKTAPPWTFTVPEGTAPGNVTFIVKAYDASEEQNPSQSTVTAYLPNGDEQPCAEDGTCPIGLECSAGLCVPGEGGLGTVCAANEECDSMLCIENEGEHRCSQTCSATTPCPEGFECAGEVACWPAKDEGGGGCATGGGADWLGAAWLLALGALLLRRRR